MHSLINSQLAEKVRKLQSLHGKILARLEQVQRTCDRAYKEADAAREKEFLEVHYVPYRQYTIRVPIAAMMNNRHIIPYRYRNHLV
jgi:hypothetical protein